MLRSCRHLVKYMALPALLLAGAGTAIAQEVTGAVDTELQQVEKEILLLEKKKQKLELEKEIRQMEASQGGTQSNPAFSVPWLGVKTGNLFFDVSELEDSSAFAITAGANLYEDYGIEMEYGTADGNLDLPLHLTALCLAYPTSFTCADGKYEMDYFGTWATWKSSGNDTYLKARAGILYEDINGVTDVGVSIGVGGGYRINQSLATELEYTIIEQDAYFMGIGLVYTISGL